jgi:prepilin-type N-terminal cleavage/methylation domain-containing protein
MARSEKIRNAQAGFSLLELVISILVLVIVMGAIFHQVNNIQKTTTTESAKLDLTDQNRQFVDQFSRDVHMSGYPAPKIYSNYQGLTDTGAASGLVFASTTDLIFEGDVYGNGTVFRVEYKYFPNDPNDPNCPCIRRSVTAKTTADPLTGYTNPVYYTEVQNVIDPTGMSEPLFTYFQASGAEVLVDSNTCSAPAPLGPPPAPAVGCADIKNNTPVIQQIDAIKVNLNTRSKQNDLQTQKQPVYSLSAIAELEN